MGDRCGIDTRVITEIADYYRDVVKANIPNNYPFVGPQDSLPPLHGGI